MQPLLVTAVLPDLYFVKLCAHDRDEGCAVEMGESRLSPILVQPSC